MFAVLRVKVLSLCEGAQDTMRRPVEELVEKYRDSVFRAALSVSRNPEDAEDAVQDTFIQYMNSKRQFESEEHIRAWLLRVAINKSKNIMTSFWNRNRVAFEDYMKNTQFQEPEDRSLAEAVFSLTEKYRVVMYLYYYEEYPVREIAEILHISEGTVKSRLARGRKALRDILKEAWDIDE